MTNRDTSGRDNYIDTDSVLAQKYAADFSIPLELAYIVAKRFPKYNDAKAFLFPDVDYLFDPATIPDIESAADQIVASINRKEGILIYSHDDVDGFTSAAIMYKTLKDIYRTDQQLIFVYPLVREKDGYILNGEVLREYRQRGVGLVITVDFGISSEHNFRVAEDLGLKLIVCDHHETCSSAFTTPVVDPKRPDSRYPFRELAGAGVSFKFAQFLYQRIFHLTASEFFKLKMEFFPLVMMGTISDRVLSRGENRIFCTHGLELCNRIDEPWINHFRGGRQLSIANIVSEIIPTIASAAYCDPNYGVGILVNDDSDYIAETAAKLRMVTVERRQNVESLFKDALAAAKIFPNVVISIIPFSKQHYLGAVAARLRNYYKRTTVVIGIKDDKCFGELRSDEIDLFKTLYHFRQFFLDFGGHRRAAGFTMLRQSLDIYVNKTVEYLSEHNEFLFNRIRSPQYLPEAFLDKSDINILKSLAPFGEGNPAPLLTDGVNVYTIDNRFFIIDKK